MSLNHLKNLKNYQFSKPDIDMLQWWLQTRKRNTWNYLNPLQYSIDCNINIETAIGLFLTCTHHKDVKTFDVRSVAKCPNCDSVITVENGCIEITDFPSFCSECCLPIEETLMDNFTEIVFQLVVDPIPPVFTPNPPTGVNTIRAEALTSSKLVTNNSSSVKSIVDRMRKLNGK